MPQVPSTRWCPTPEQLMILEEMYRTGVRTPNASQIQQITSHLSYYGKIEGKNVFYWFQNHKARERQKLRRRLTKQQQQQSMQQLSQHPFHFHSLEDANSLSLPEDSSQLLYGHQINSQFLQHGGGFQETRPQGMDLLRRLETAGHQEEASSSSPSSSMLLPCGCEWMTMADPSFGESPCCIPPQTLELFPTTSTGLKDECSISKSSSCSASTN